MTKYIVSILQDKIVGLLRDLNNIDSTGQEYAISNMKLGGYNFNQSLYKSGTVQNTSRFSTPHFCIS